MLAVQFENVNKNDAHLNKIYLFIILIDCNAF